MKFSQFFKQKTVVEEARKPSEETIKKTSEYIDKLKKLKIDGVKKIGAAAKVLNLKNVSTTTNGRINLGVVVENNIPRSTVKNNFKKKLVKSVLDDVGSHSESLSIPEDGFNLIFKYDGSGGKIAASTKTTVQETITQVIIDNYLSKNKILEPNECEVETFKLLDGIANVKRAYDIKYYNSALVQLEQFKKLNAVKSGMKYVVERQKDNHTIGIYKTATKLTGDSADNWNPADVWVIESKDGVKALKEIPNEIKELSEATDKLEFLAKRLVELYDAGLVIPISLKMISSGKGKLEKVNYQPNVAYDPKLFEDYFITISKPTNVYRGPGNAYFKSKKGDFSFRIGYKSSSVSYKPDWEGSYFISNTQLGAASKKMVSSFIDDNIKSYPKASKLWNDARASNLDSLSDEDLDLLFKKMKKEIMGASATKYSIPKTEIKYFDIETEDPVVKKRLIALTSQILVFGELIKNNETFLPELKLISEKKHKKASFFIKIY